MQKNMRYAIVAVVVIIIVVVAVAGAYVLMNPGTEEGGGGGTETVYTISNATSLTYTVNSSASAGAVTKLSGKNLNTVDMVVRVDIEVAGDTYSYLLNATAQSYWANDTGTWVQGVFQTGWNDWNTNQWQVYVGNTPGWMAGDPDITFTDSTGASIVVYDIQINPTLDDSLFAPPA